MTRDEPAPVADLSRLMGRPWVAWVAATAAACCAVIVLLALIPAIPITPIMPGPETDLRVAGLGLGATAAITGRWCNRRAPALIGVVAMVIGALALVAGFASWISRTV